MGYLSYESLPIFIRLSHEIEDHILSGVFQPEERIPSMNEYSLSLNINPHTVLKAMNLLVDRGILYKKRGLGMFVTIDAVHIIQQDRMKLFEEQRVKSLVKEAVKLGISKEELLKSLLGCYEQLEADRGE